MCSQTWKNAIIFFLTKKQKRTIIVLLCVGQWEIEKKTKGVGFFITGWEDIVLVKINDM